MSMLTQKLRLRFGTSKIRTKALAWLAVSSHPEANGLLFHSLDDPDEGVRTAAINAIGQRAFKDSSAVMLLVDALDHSDPRVNRSALDSLVLAVKQEPPFTVKNALSLLLERDLSSTIDVLRTMANSNAVYLLLKIAPAQVVSPLLRLPDSDPDKVAGILERVVADHLSDIPNDDLQELARKAPSEKVLAYGRHGSLGGSTKTTVCFTHLNKVARWELIRRNELDESEDERAARLGLHALRSRLIAILGNPQTNATDRLLARCVLEADDTDVPAVLRKELNASRHELSSLVRPGILLSLLGPLLDRDSMVAEIVNSVGEGDKDLEQAKYLAATRQYEKAVDLFMVLPEADPFKDKCFVMSCLAAVTFARAQLGKDDLKAAEKVTDWFESNGDRYPAEYGKWLLAMLSKAIALAGLGRLAEAAEQRDRIKRMLRDPLAKSPPAKRFEGHIDSCVRKLDHLLAPNPDVNQPGT